jgi:hypothetical protein
MGMGPIHILLPELQKDGIEDIVYKMAVLPEYTGKLPPVEFENITREGEPGDQQSRLVARVVENPVYGTGINQFVVLHNPQK